MKSFLAQAQAGFLQLTGDPVAARRMALQALEDVRQQQSSALAYFDTFLVFAAVGVAFSFLVLLMKPSVAAKGAQRCRNPREPTVGLYRTGRLPTARRP